MTRWSSVLFQVSVLLVASGCSRINPKLEEQATGLLLQRYETVVAARSRLLPQLLPNQNKESGPIALGLPFVYLMAGLKPVGSNAFNVVTGGSSIVLTGAKDFVAPEDLGMVTGRTSTVAVLTSGAARTLTAEFSKIDAAVMEGRRVWSWSIPLWQGNKAERFYATLVANSFFVLSNDATEFREVANALDNGSTIVAIPPEVTPLRAHAYWASRMIRRDPPADHWATGLAELPASTTSLQLFTEFDDGKLVFNIFVPDAPSNSLLKGLPSSESIRFEQASPGKWQAVIPLLANAPETTAAVVGALAYFGYGLFL